jgi:polyisoprenoid-binding protein YceI
MKTPFTNTIHLTKSRVAGILIAVVMSTILPLAFAADGTTWSLDASTSSAQLFQGSRANPESVNTGVARVTGDVRLDTNNLDSSVVDLSIYPADENWARALNSDGSLATAFVPDATDHTLLTFKSTRIVSTANGNLDVTGDLTLTRVERSVTMDPNEGYSGPEYGAPIIHTETREVTFLFPNSSNTSLSGGLTPVSLRTNNNVEFSGSTHVGHEDFPQLLGAMQDTNWPAVVKDEVCKNSSTVGEDYHGPSCTGTVIAATHKDNCQTSISGGAEDYAGPVCTPPAGDETTIALDLKMLPTGASGSTAMLSGSTASR